MQSTFLYCITCVATGKMYVGITASPPERRWRQHLNASRSMTQKHRKFQHALRKYGEASFEFETLHAYCSRAAASEAEVALIAALDTIDNGYNSSPGGEYPKMTAATRAKMSLSRKGVKRGPINEERRLILSKAHRGRSPSQSTRDKLSAANKGKRKSEETKRRSSVSALARRLRERLNDASFSVLPIGVPPKNTDYADVVF